MWSGILLTFSEALGTLCVGKVDLNSGLVRKQKVGTSASNEVTPIGAAQVMLHALGVALDYLPWQTFDIRVTSCHIMYSVCNDFGFVENQAAARNLVALLYQRR